jgi:hypothetical protein
MRNVWWPSISFSLTATELASFGLWAWSKCDSFYSALRIIRSTAYMQSAFLFENDTPSVLKYLYISYPDIF